MTTPACVPSPFTTVGFDVCAQAVANKGEPFISGIQSSPEGLTRWLSDVGSLALDEHLTADSIVERFLPHEVSRARNKETVINPFYSYLSARKV